MNIESRQTPTDARATVESHFARMRLARATELAHAGRLLEAEAVLAVNGELPNEARELDLLARIAAYQGRFDRARRLWDAAIQKDPQNTVYRQCVEWLTPGRRIARLIVKSQDALLNIMVWTTIAFGIGALIYTLCPK